MEFDNFRYNDFGLPPKRTLRIWACRKRDVYMEEDERNKPENEIGYFCYPPVNGFGNGMMKLESEKLGRMIRAASENGYEISLIVKSGRGGSGRHLSDKSIKIIEDYAGEAAQPLPEQPGEFF